MAVGTCLMYTANFNILDPNDILSATVKMALVASTYTPNYTQTGDDVWADLSANEIAGGNGYTTGGFTITTDVLTALASGYKYSSDNVSWTASGGSIPAWRYAVCYISGALWAKTDPLLFSFLGDDTPADIPATTDGNTLQLTVPSGGWFDIT